MRTYGQTYSNSAVLTNIHGRSRPSPDRGQTLSGESDSYTPTVSHTGLRLFSYVQQAYGTRRCDSRILNTGQAYHIGKARLRHPLANDFAL